MRTGIFTVIRQMNALKVASIHRFYSQGVSWDHCNFYYASIKVHNVLITTCVCVMHTCISRICVRDVTVRLLCKSKIRNSGHMRERTNKIISYLSGQKPIPNSG